jgi:4-diphosphocytidyl-2-C-methyl-D-erythritol kinase
MPDALPDWPDAAALAGWLAAQRNDLEPPARAIAPAIDGVLAALTALPGALFARMSGSGATCFALFAREDAAQDAALALRTDQPAWWVAAGQLYPGRADMGALIRDAS